MKFYLICFIGILCIIRIKGSTRLARFPNDAHSRKDKVDHINMDSRQKSNTTEFSNATNSKIEIKNNTVEVLELQELLNKIKESHHKINRKATIACFVALVIATLGLFRLVTSDALAILAAFLALIGLVTSVVTIKFAYELDAEVKYLKDRIRRTKQ